jgi:ssDNA-binding Zn-finger/Zn-ribbon topoisomerase 1
MPMYQFRCPDGHEFEKIVPARHKIMKWCKHCNELTEWTKISEVHSQFYAQKVCSICLGSDTVPPMPGKHTLVVEEDVSLPCPECGHLAEHVLRIEKRGSHGPETTVADSSVRFHFNWLSPDV